MLTDDLVRNVGQLLRPWTSGVRQPEAGRLDLELPSDNLLPAVGALVTRSRAYLSAVTGLDLGAEAGAIEVLYHFCDGPGVVTLRVRVPREDGQVPSLCGLIPSAGIFERELAEMFGVRVADSPDERPLLLPEDWPASVYPLLKDADLASKEPPSAPTPQVGRNEGKLRRFILPVGPQHPALKEPGRFELDVDGEVVRAASVRLGYAHRGIEKAVEERNWVQDLYLLERICGICSHVHAMAYCLAVEQLAHVEAPPRAQAIRALVAELERIHSHLLWLGVTAHEAGFDTLFMYVWRDRETVMDLLEALTGNRVNYSANLLGGVKVDVDPAQVSAILRGVDFLEERTHRYADDATRDEPFLRRTRGVGVMSAEQAGRLGVVGPTARASGLTRDVRVEAPYAGYRLVPARVVTADAGDLEARVRVRLLDLFESYRLVRALLGSMPAGELTVRVPRRIPAGETVSRVEAPRGELFYFVKSNGTDKPERIKVRTPTLSNMSSALALAVGRFVADVPMLLAGVDPCFSCNDRAVVLRRPDNDEAWSWARLRRHGIEFYR
jgi:ech hydrogenase subunit E